MDTCRTRIEEKLIQVAPVDPPVFVFRVVCNRLSGMKTPPVGMVLFVLSGITKLPIFEMMRNVCPFVPPQYGVLALSPVFPAIVTALPRPLGS